MVAALCRNNAQKTTSHLVSATNMVVLPQTTKKDNY